MSLWWHVGLPDCTHPDSSIAAYSPGYLVQREKNRFIAEYNRIHTASRPNLEVSKVSDLFEIKHYGSKSIFAFKAEEMYVQWLRVVAEGSDA
jgi:hypothetical protein